MRVPVKLLRFGFWLFFLNSARCQDCLRDDIEYENTELAAKPSYGDGETVKVTCVTGYIGSYKLKCIKGKWKKTVGRSCMKKKCNHPGDTPNGDFKLAEGAEFVFGATVVYTCNKGYEMTSRINQRTCRAQGWDNAVPVCEVVKCPAIQTDGDLTASGNTEEGSYGDVIQFECVSSDKKITGSSDIHCEETGEWSDAVPKCIDITCRAPVISNGYVIESLPEYPKDAILKYQCNKKFKPREGISRCTKFGWNLKPECDEVTCDLKSITYGIIKINPQGRNIFKAGESVEITCSEKHWIFFTKETDKTFTCQDNGEWDHKPGCEDIRCEVPHFQHVSSPDYYFRRDKKLGTKHYYYCESGYEKMAEKATCTQDGWTPNPLCEIMCEAPNIPNAEFVEVQRYRKYRINSILEYKCRPGFEPEEPVQITCNHHRQWTGLQQCTEMCAAPDIPNAEIVGDERSSYYRISSILKYKCLTGFEPEEPVQITCGSYRQWRGIQQCTEMCAAPNIQNAEIVGDETSYYKINSVLEYKCRPGFEPEEPVQITCNNRRQWRGIQQCTEIMCAAPNIPNAEIVGVERSNYYRISSVLEYKCRPGFEPEEPLKITCNHHGQWTGLQHCTEMCAAPNISNAEIIGDERSNYYSIRSVLEYKCLTGFEPEEPVQITCGSHRQWTGIQQCTEMCAVPNIPNAQIFGAERSNYYNMSSILEYKCHPGFEPEEPVQITCDSKAQWTDIQQCTAKQKMCPDISVENGIIHRQSSKKGEIWYSCKTGYKTFTGNWWNSVTCSEGSWSDEPRCIPEEECGALPSVLYGKLKQTKQTFRDGQTTAFECDPGFVSTAGFIKCTNGTWETPVCMEVQKCEIPPKVENAVITSKPEEFYVDGSNVTYICQSPFEMSGKSTIFCRNGKWEETPTCEAKCHKPREYFMQLVNEKDVYNNKEILKYNCIEPYNKIPEGEWICENGKWSGQFVCTSQTCPPPPYLENGDYYKYYQDEEVATLVQYRCQSLYVLQERKQYYKCENGKWDSSPKCLKPCEITSEILEAQNRRPIQEKIYLIHGQQHYFHCKSGFFVGWSHGSYNECFDGTINLEKCQKYY